MRFCMVTTFYPPQHFGGDGVYVYRLARALAERGHSVDVVHSADAYRLLSSQPEARGFPDLPGVRVHSLTSWAGALELLITQQTGRPWLHEAALRRILGERDVDVIHFHNVSLVGGPATLRLGSALKLYTLHEHWLVCPMHTLWRYGREACGKRTCIRCQIVGRRPPQLWRHTRLLDRCVRHVDSFIAPSRFTFDKHRELGLDAPMRHLPHFVPSVPCQLPPPQSGARGFFLYAGRLEREKGVDCLVRTFRRYRAADLVVAGDGRERQRLIEETRDLPHVRLVGRLAQEPLRELNQRAIATLVPSECYEVFGLTAVEAFAVGTPAIVRRLGSLPELIEDSGGGLAFDTDDELIEAMERLRRSPRLRLQMGSRAREAQRERWSEEAHLRGYLGIIEELRARRSAGASTGGT